MKRFLIILAMGLLSISSAAVAADDVEKPLSCEQCGMDRVVFARSRMLVVYADGSTAGTCSIHCAVADMKAHKGKKVTSLQVADYDSRQLIDAGKAVWVIGGSKRGVMTSVPKWAFADKSAAEKFVRENGGTVTTFDETMKLAEREAAM